MKHKHAELNSSKMLVFYQHSAQYSNTVKSCTAYNQWNSLSDLGDHFCLRITFVVVQALVFNVRRNCHEMGASLTFGIFGPFRNHG